MDDISFEFIVDYGKHRAGENKTDPYELVVYELQYFVGSDFSDKPDNFYKEKPIVEKFKANLRREVNKLEVRESIFLKELYKDLNVMQIDGRYYGNEEFKKKVLEFSKNYSAFSKDKSLEFDKTNIDYFLRNRNLYQLEYVSSKYKTSKTILDILENKFIQRLILNSDVVTRAFIPKCFICRLEELKESKEYNNDHIIRTIVNYFKDYSSIVIKKQGDYALGRGNLFLEKLDLKEMVKNHPYFIGGGSNPLLLIEGVSNVGMKSRKPDNNSITTYRAAVVYHISGNGNVLLYNAINIHAEKTDRNQPDSHGWTSAYHFVAEKPRELQRTAKSKDIAYCDSGDKNNYNYSISKLDFGKVARNLNLKDNKPDLFNKFFQIALLLGSFDKKIFIDYLNNSFKNNVDGVVGNIQIFRSYTNFEKYDNLALIVKQFEMLTPNS